MAQDNPAIIVTLDPETAQSLAAFARQNQQTLSIAAADLLRKGLELHDDELIQKSETFASITPDALHPESDFGKAAGKEIW